MRRHILYGTMVKMGNNFLPLLEIGVYDAHPLFGIPEVLSCLKVLLESQELDDSH